MKDKSMTLYDLGLLDERDRILKIIMEDDWSGESLAEDREHLGRLIMMPYVEEI